MRARQVEEGERVRFSAGDGNLFPVSMQESARAEAQMPLADRHIDYLQTQAALRDITWRL